MTASNPKSETARNATQGVARQANLLDSAGTPWYAVKHGNLELITRLFPSTCNVYAKGPVGENVFHVSMLLNTPSTLAIAKYLVNQCYGKTLVNTPYQERRHDKDAPGLFEGETALHIAIVNRNFDMVKFLIQAGADVRARCYGPFFKVGSPVYYGEFPLSFAASTGQKDIVSFLKRHGARVNSDCDTNGNTALHLSVAHSQLDMYDHLVDFCGASEYVRNNRGATPLLLAASLGKLEVFQHIYHKRRRVAWAYGPVTSYCLSLHEIDTVQSSSKAYVPNALETIIRKGHMHMLDDPIIMTLLRHKWKRFASFQFCVQALLLLVLVLVQTFLIWLHCKASMYNSSSRQALEISALILAAVLLIVEVADTTNWAHLVYRRRQLMKKDPKYCPPLYPIPGDTHEVPTKQKTGFLSRIVGGNNNNKGPVAEGLEGGRIGHGQSLVEGQTVTYSSASRDHEALDISVNNYWTYPQVSHGFTTRAVAEGSEQQQQQAVCDGPQQAPGLTQGELQDDDHEQPDSPFATAPAVASVMSREYSCGQVEPPLDIVSVGLAGATGAPTAMRRIPSFFVSSSAGGGASGASFISRTASTHVGSDLDDLHPRPVMLNGMRSSFQHVHGIPGVNPALGPGPAAASAISHYTLGASLRPGGVDPSLAGQQNSLGSSTTGQSQYLDRVTGGGGGGGGGRAGSGALGGVIGSVNDPPRPTASTGQLNTVNGVVMPGQPAGVAGQGDAVQASEAAGAGGGGGSSERPSKAESTVGGGEGGITTRPSSTEFRNRLRKGGGGDLPDGFTGGVGSTSLRRSESKPATVISHVNWSSSGSPPLDKDPSAEAGGDTREPLVTQGMTGFAQTLQHALSGYYRRQLQDPTTLLSACHLTFTLIHFITWAAAYGGPDGSGPRNPKAQEFDDIIVSCMAITGWLSLLYFTRGWEYFGSFQVMIELCMAQLFKFCCIFFLFNIGWALAFMSLLNGTTEILQGKDSDSDSVPVLDNIGIAMLELIRFLYGEAEYRSYTATGSRAKRAVATCWFILYVAVVLLLLTKLLAAMVIAAHGAYEDKARKIWLMRWASYVLRAEARLPLPSQQACRLGESSYDPGIGAKVYNHVYEVVDHEAGKGAGNATGGDVREQEIAALEAALERIRRDQGSS